MFKLKKKKKRNETQKTFQGGPVLQAFQIKKDRNQRGNIIK